MPEALYRVAGSLDCKGVVEVNTRTLTVWGEKEEPQPWVNTHLWHGVLPVFHYVLLVAYPKAYPHLTTQNQDPRHIVFLNLHRPLNY